MMINDNQKTGAYIQTANDGSTNTLTMKLSSSAQNINNDSGTVVEQIVNTLGTVQHTFNSQNIVAPNQVVSSSSSLTTKSYVDSVASTSAITGLIYVGKNGNDTSGNGSAAKPYLTIQKAIDVILTMALILRSL